mgnify:CR=1 FL=1
MSEPAPPRQIGRILVVDDDRSVRTALQVNLRKAGWEVELATDGDEAFGRLREAGFDIVLTDVMMPTITGLELLARIRSSWPATRVVVMTGHGSVPDAVAALKAGADDYIIKPVSKDELLVILARAMREKALLAEVQQLRAELDGRFGFESLIGNTTVMREVYEQVAAVADSDALVLLTGPTGTGKELLSHAIHQRSPRRSAPFVTVNCGALPEGLLESELFGHERGAFTGAVRQHLGRFEQAEGGTILLDEIGEIPPSTQVKLLRVLESGEIQRVGASSSRRVDVRVVAATNRNLRAEVKAGRLREDLYYRLNVFHIEVPALHERLDDLPLLANHFLQRFAERYNRPARRLSAAALDQLMKHRWPGNVRELEHTLERAVLLSRGEEIEKVQISQSDLSEPEGGPSAPIGTLPPGKSLPDALDDIERATIIEALQRAGGVQARAARQLGISRSNLNYRIGRLGISLRAVDYD